MGVASAHRPVRQVTWELLKCPNHSATAKSHLPKVTEIVSVQDSEANSVRLLSEKTI